MKKNQRKENKPGESFLYEKVQGLVVLSKSVNQDETQFYDNCRNSRALIG